MGATQLRYHLRAVEDVHAMLKAHGDWMPLCNADEQKPVKEGTVEAFGRSSDNPIGGWYGMKKGLRGRFGNYLPPCWRCSVWPRWSTTPATTECAPSSCDNRGRCPWVDGVFG